MVAYLAHIPIYGFWSFADALEFIFDSLALLVSLSVGSRGRSIEMYAVVFDERTNASRTQFERRKSVG